MEGRCLPVYSATGPYLVLLALIWLEDIAVVVIFVGRARIRYEVHCITWSLALSFNCMQLWL